MYQIRSYLIAKIIKIKWTVKLGFQFMYDLCSNIEKLKINSKIIELKDNLLVLLNCGLWQALAHVTIAEIR